MENEDPLGCHVFDFVVDVTCLTSTYSESHRTLMLCGSIGTLCSCAVSKAVGKWGSREWQTHILHTSPPLTCTSHVPIGLHPLNTSSKIKLSRLSRQTAAAGHYTKHRALLLAEPCVTVWVTRPWRQPWGQNKKSAESRDHCVTVELPKQTTFRRFLN